MKVFLVETSPIHTNVFAAVEGIRWGGKEFGRLPCGERPAEYSVRNRADSEREKEASLHTYQAVAQASQFPDGAEHVRCSAPKYDSIRVLLSYHYYKRLDFPRFISTLAPLSVGIFIDSGAYFAFSQGSQIVLSEYAGYLRACAPLVSHYANLDVIGDPAGTLENQRRLEEEGLRPIPVFHVGEDFGYLERYCEEYDYVALGGMVPHLRFKSRLMSWLVKCFRVAEASAKKTGFHGFGCTSWDIVKTFPWRSVGSSS